MADALEQGIALYGAAIDIFIGERVEKYGITAPGRVEPWVDMAGLLAPQSEVEHFMALMRNDENLTISKLSKMVRSLHAGYDEWCNEWCSALIHTEYGPDVIPEELIHRGAEAKIWLLKRVLNDAAKEFSPASTVGFGLDAESLDEVECDIENVRGSLEENPLVCSLLEEILTLEKK